MSITCMIVDDEPIAQTILETYIAKIPSLELIHKCKNALEASIYLHENSVQLIFLDISMPQMTGFEFLDTLTQKPQIIITTAYSEYALQGYEYAVVDYLLKPISFSRFMRAINKLPELSGNTISVQPLPVQENSHFTLTDINNHKIRMNYDDIDYIQGYGNYIKIFYNGDYTLYSCSLQLIENQVPGDLFIRIHKSFIVAKNKITAFTKDEVSIGATVLSIGNSYKMLVAKNLNA